MISIQNKKFRMKIHLLILVLISIACNCLASDDSVKKNPSYPHENIDCLYLRLMMINSSSEPIEVYIYSNQADRKTQELLPGESVCWEGIRLLHYQGGGGWRGEIGIVGKYGVKIRYYNLTNIYRKLALHQELNKNVHHIRALSSTYKRKKEPPLLLDWKTVNRNTIYYTTSKRTGLVLEYNFADVHTPERARLQAVIFNYGDNLPNKHAVDWRQATYKLKGLEKVKHGK